MKNLLLTLAATLAVSCVAFAPTNLVPTDGAIGREIERVLTRHDAYVNADGSLTAAVRELELGQSSDVRALTALGQADRAALGSAVRPVADRHDSYVQADNRLAPDDRATFLYGTDLLRRLLLVQ